MASDYLLCLSVLVPYCFYTKPFFGLSSDLPAGLRLPVRNIAVKRLKNTVHGREHGWESNAWVVAIPFQRNRPMTQCLKSGYAFSSRMVQTVQTSLFWDGFPAPVEFSDPSGEARFALA